MGHHKRIELRVDRYTQVCLTVIAVLLTVLIAGLWTDGVPGPDGLRAADNGILPNAGRQRKQMVDALDRQTQQLDRLVSLFESGKAKVQIEQDGKDAVAKPAPRRKAK